MRRKNRKKVRSRLRTRVVPVRFAGITVLLTLFLLAYLGLDLRCDGIGRQVKKLETERAGLNIRLGEEQYKWTCMSDMPNIEKALAKWNIVMAWPRSEQVIRLYEAGEFETRLVQSAKASLKYARLERGRNE
jgi:hypothetical protein